MKQLLKQNKIMIYLAQKGVKHPTFTNTNDMTAYLKENELLWTDVKKVGNIWKLIIKNLSA